VGRRRYHRAMPWWTWVALGFFAVVVVALLAFAALLFVRLKRLRDRGDILQAELEALAGKAEHLEDRLERAEERAERARRSLERLDASLQRLSVLTWALGDARRAVTQLRSGLLRK
jgi:predicted RNase H-like nuclease (RuvC/YqgF family)